MSREIKFRAWDNKINDWAICSLFLDTTELDPRKQGRDKSLILMSQHDDIIIEQFTGLYDKNGVEIFDGDILEYELEDHIGSVKFTAGCFLSDCMGWGDDCLSNANEDFIKIIGNIHENPELLRQSESEEL